MPDAPGSGPEHIQREVEPVLRPARAGDVDAIRALVDAAYRGYLPLLGRTPKPMLSDVAAALRDHDVRVLDRDGTIVGVIELIARDDHLWVHNVAIDPAWQGRGYGRRLLALADEEARRLGLPAVGLLTNERYVANVAMYERYGFRETHREPYLGTDLVHFRKPIRG